MTTQDASPSPSLTPEPHGTAVELVSNRLLGPRPLTPEDVTAAADTAYDLGRRHKSEEVQAGAGNGVELIARERARQKAVEGWTPEHDAEHDGEQMAYAAACYALPDVSRQHEGRSVLVNTARGLAEPDCFRSAESSAPRLWPWDAEWWKPVPQDRVRELVKAGALIAAEIDRLQRSPDGPNAVVSHTGALPDCKISNQVPSPGVGL